MKSIGAITLTVFFLLELGGMAAFGYSGYHMRTEGPLRIILAVTLPLVFVILWGVLLSPKASIPIFSFPMRTTLKLVVFVLASATLIAVGRSVIGVVFLMISLVIVAIVFILKLHEVKM